MGRGIIKPIPSARINCGRCERVAHLTVIGGDFPAEAKRLGWQTTPQEGWICPNHVTRVGSPLTFTMIGEDGVEHDLTKYVGEIKPTRAGGDPEGMITSEWRNMTIRWNEANLHLQPFPTDHPDLDLVLTAEQTAQVLAWIKAGYFNEQHDDQEGV